MEMTSIEMYDINGEKRNVFATGDDIIIKIDYKVHVPTQNVVFGVGVFRGDGLYCYGSNTRIDHFDEYNISKDGQVTLHLKHINLLPGQYVVDLAIEEDIGKAVDYFKGATRFEMYSKLQEVGAVRLDHEWDIETAEYVKK